jgi:type II secretory pathway pseudopilin PulG
VELLVAITIISIMAGIAMVAVGRTREEARIAKTKATIAKLDLLIQQRYESYQTRRVPVNLSGLTPKKAREVRLLALRYLMWMEMPDRFSDINPNAGTGTVTLTDGKTMPWPSLAIQFGRRDKSKRTDDFMHGECLYLVVASDPEALAMFASDEIGDVDNDGWPEFLDGWGRPIYWLRWAPGFTIENRYSEIQTKDGTKAPDPFNPHYADPDGRNGYHLIPLIYSAGPDKKYGVNIGKGHHFNGNPFANLDIGTEDTTDPEEKGAMTDNIHNHLIEQR